MKVNVQKGRLKTVAETHVRTNFGENTNLVPSYGPGYYFHSYFGFSSQFWQAKLGGETHVRTNYCGNTNFLTSFIVLHAIFIPIFSLVPSFDKTEGRYTTPVWNTLQITWLCSISTPTSVACAVDPSVKPLQNRETQHVNIVLQCMYRFF
jgi:hypothetical protein